MNIRKPYKRPKHPDDIPSTFQKYADGDSAHLNTCPPVRGVPGVPELVLQRAARHQAAHQRTKDERNLALHHACFIQWNQRVEDARSRCREIIQRCPADQLPRLLMIARISDAELLAYLVCDPRPGSMGMVCRAR